MILHRPLHRVADGTGLASALGMANPVEPRNRGLGRSRRHGTVALNKNLFAGKPTPDQSQAMAGYAPFLTYKMVRPVIHK